MAYVAGTANSLTELLAAIQAACTGNGWTLSGNVLHKGTCYMEVKIVGTTYARIVVNGGIGIDGSNALTGASNVPGAAMGRPIAAGDRTLPITNLTFAAPYTYQISIHTNPDEVYVIVNFATTFYQWLAFGQSDMPGLVGTGNWYAGFARDYDFSLNQVDIRSDGGFSNLVGYFSAGFGMFSVGQTSSAVQKALGVDHKLDSNTWDTDGCARDFASLFWRQPSQWNQEAALIPIRVYAQRPSGFVSTILECRHARFVNIAALSDQQVITLGPDKWKVYPWFARGVPYATNGINGTYTGVCGHAIRYDGS